MISQSHKATCRYQNTVFWLADSANASDPPGESIGLKSCLVIVAAYE
jgi:hypothetical protein